MPDKTQDELRHEMMEQLMQSGNPMIMQEIAMPGVVTNVVMPDE